MPDPITLTMVGTLALTEGMKFLYVQAGELIKQWRERRELPTKEAAAGALTVTLPTDVFDGSLRDPRIDLNQVGAAQTRLIHLVKELSLYASGTLPVEQDRRAVVAATDELRQVFEELLGQRITFKGESRPATGTVIRGAIRADVIEGHAVGVQAGDVEGATVEGTVEVGKVGPGGSVFGVQVHRTHGSAPLDDPDPSP